MQTIPIGPGFGAEVRGVSLLDAASSAEAFAYVEAAFEEHSILLFRGQEVTDTTQIAYSRGFGPLELGKVGSRSAGSFLGVISNIGDDGSLLIMMWGCLVQQTWHAAHQCRYPRPVPVAPGL